MDMTPLDPIEPSDEESKFVKELKRLLNIECKENASNTPDFILANYLNNCLWAFDRAVQQRETWYGRDSRPTQLQVKGEDGSK